MIYARKFFSTFGEILRYGGSTFTALSKLFAAKKIEYCLRVMRYGFFLTMILTFAMYGYDFHGRCGKIFRHRHLRGDVRADSTVPAFQRTFTEKNFCLKELICLENFSVAISFCGSLGWVEYDEVAKKVIVNLGDDEGKKLVEDFLSTPHKIKVPHETLLDFTEETFDANESADSLKIVLTRLWEATGVHVDWSRPVDYVKAHPHY